MTDVRFHGREEVPALDTGGLRRLCLRVLSDNRPDALEVNVVFVDDDYIADLNQRFLDKAGPTDVLAFDLGCTPPFEVAAGEVYVSVERAREQAETHAVSLEEEVARLVVHGVLHLSGWDDTTAADRRSMHERTEAYLKAFPYWGTVSQTGASSG